MTMYSRPDQQANFCYPRPPHPVITLTSYCPYLISNSPITMSRSRTGCSTCKRRHRKCDETKPTCLECQKNNLTCEGYALKLQWDVGVASRGKLTGASLPVLGAGNERKRERGLEIDGAEGSFGQFQALPLGQVEASGLGSEVLMDMEYPVIETEEPQWLQRRSDQEKQLFKECKPPTNAYTAPLTIKLYKKPSFCSTLPLQKTHSLLNSNASPSKTNHCISG